MAPKMSDWITKARKRWPRSFKEKEIFGDGRYAVLTCAFSHPSAGQMMYSEVHLSPTEHHGFQISVGHFPKRTALPCADQGSVLTQSPVDRPAHNEAD